MMCLQFLSIYSFLVIVFHDNFSTVTEKNNSKKIIPLTKLMQMLKDKEFTCVTETDSRKLFNLMDMNQDGYLDFEDFVKVQKKIIHTLCSIYHAYL